MGRARHMFPGGNTPGGFFSYYPYILPQDAADRIYCIKGGPGVGKSTFMKAIGGEMERRGIAVEYMHCSSDPDSLDGLVLPARRRALLDGTAPHVVDPKHPGAVDSIVNLGECWREEGIRRNRREIVEDVSAIGRLFERVYRYLGAAKKIHEDLEAVATRCTAEGAADEELEKALPLLGEPAGGRGRVRRLFASAITPSGLIHHLDSLLGGNKVVVVGGEGKAPPEFLSKLSAAAVRRGKDVEEFYCPMDPTGRLEHLVVPSQQLAFTTANRYHGLPGTQGPAVDFGAYADRAALSREEDSLAFGREQLDILLRQAVAALQQAKALHDHLETFYIPNMDFEAVTRKRDEILEVLLA